MLRGRLRPPAPIELDTEIARQAKRERGDAFAAQAEALLYDADLLVAIDDPDDEGEVGGTRDTLTRAIELGMPVIVLHLGRPGVRLMVSGEGPTRGLTSRASRRGTRSRCWSTGFSDLNNKPQAMTA